MTIGSVDGIKDAMNAVRRVSNYYCTVLKNAKHQDSGAMDATLANLTSYQLESLVNPPMS